MKTKLILIATLISIALSSIAQTERSYIRQGNREFKKEQYLDSEISYRSALEKNPTSVKGNFNLGGSLFKQDKFDEAKGTFEGITQSGADANIRAKAFHNLGNTLFKQQKFAEAADAYKSALRLNPADSETKYNLSEVLRMLREQQNQQNQGDGKGKDDEKQNDKNDDKQKQNDPQDKQDDKNQQNKQQPQEQKISPEDAKRMLEAIQKNERNVQQKVLEKQAKEVKVRVDKNW